MQSEGNPIKRTVEILQDVYWAESLAAAQLTEHVSQPSDVREYIRDRAFHQPSWETRDRYALYFLKWFMPNASLDDPVPVAWRAFHDATTLGHVMRWQFITANPLIAEFVDGPFSVIEPGDAVNAAVDSFLVERLGSLPARTRARLRAALTKAGLLTVDAKHVYHRLIADVSPRAVAVIVTHLFAPKPQAIAIDTLLADPWWKRLGILDEPALRLKLKESVECGLFARVLRMDTLDQLTTRYSWQELARGRLKAR